jgi:hypothetical protein
MGGRKVAPGKAADLWRRSAAEAQAAARGKKPLCPSSLFSLSGLARLCAPNRKAKNERRGFCVRNSGRRSFLTGPGLLSGHPCGISRRLEVEMLDSALQVLTMETDARCFGIWLAS